MKTLFNVLSSLKLTIILLILSMALVFFGTLDQVNYGVFETQRRYFESFFVVWHFPGSSFGIPLVGGYLLGFLLLLNLGGAHFKYFRKSWKKVGIVLIHVGITILLIGGFFTSWLQEESQMWIEEGKEANYSASTSINELVIIDKSNAAFDKVHSVPEGYLPSGQWITLGGGTPFRMRAVEFFENAELGMKQQNPDAPKSPANQGAALKMGLVAFPKPISYKDDQPNAATGYIEVEADGESLGVWLLSNIIDNRFPPQSFEYKGKQYELALRFKRKYFPFSFQLLEFTHEKYPGTDIPKYFSSKVILKDPKKEDRQVLIYMNNPLRYAGHTFFQASFGNGDKASMLQVVRNPSWLMPYMAIILVGLGLLVHFVMRLMDYLKRK